METCGTCFNEFPEDVFIEHSNKCLAEQIVHLKQLTPETQQNIVPLTETQKKAIDYSVKKSKIFSKNTHLNVVERFVHLGFDEIILKKTVKYLESLNIVIHLDISRDIKLILKDGYYKNQFETGTSHGALSRVARLDWEANLFKGIYNQSTDSEKVKYGAVNLLSQKSGVLGAYGYGNSYLLLKQSVKERATFVIGDSATKQIHIITFKHPTVILNLIDDRLLNQVIFKANNLPGIIPNMSYSYIEAQIHGPLNIFTDVEMIMLNPVYRKNTDILSLLDKYGIKYDFIS